MINEYIYLSTDHNRSRRVIYRNKILLFSHILIIYSCSLKPTNTTTSTSIGSENKNNICPCHSVLRTSAQEHRASLSGKNPVTSDEAGGQREDEDVIKLAELLADQTTSNENMVWCSRSIGVLANYKVNHPILPGWPSRREEEVSDSCDSKAHN